ncbi:hypothetical protein PEX1_020520 [Penicillium expansum]|nr:hypothetical protein PEX1_020520 [Penicillium expansum]
MPQFDFTKSEIERHGWDQCDAIAPNEQSEPDPKRQCIEHSWRTHESVLDPYSLFSNLDPITNTQDPEVSLSSEYIWPGFEDEVPTSNFDLMDFSNLKNEGFSDLTQESSGFYLQAPELSDATQSLPTPNSDSDFPDLQPKMFAAPSTLPEDVIFPPQTFPSKLYDTCFGMIITNASCHSLPNDTQDFIPVSIQVFGDVLKMGDDKTNRKFGLLHSPALAKLAREFTVTFSAKCETTKEQKGKRQSLGYKDTPVHIVLYGFCEDMSAVEETLSEGGLFLQHPTEGDASVPYRNPQFLMPPGTEMPQIEDLANGSVSAVTKVDQSFDEKWASEVFQAFEGVDGPAEFAPVEPSPRLKTMLKEHQMKALSMMTEKERGVIEEADFPSLWEVLRDFDGNVK